VSFIQEVRSQEGNRVKEMEQVRRELERTQMEMAERERKWRKERADIERECEGRIAGMAQENENNKVLMRQKL
jgi:hypothetical protein